MRFSLPKVFQLAAWARLALTTALSLVPATFRPATGLPHNLEHLAIFAVTGVAFGLGFSRWRGFLVPALVVFAAAVEITQSAIPSRHARLEDFIIDAVAVSVSAVIAATIARRGQLRAHCGVRAASHSRARFSGAATQLSCTRRISGTDAFASSPEAHAGSPAHKIQSWFENRGLRENGAWQMAPEPEPSSTRQLCRGRRSVGNARAIKCGSTRDPHQQVFHPQIVRAGGLLPDALGGEAFCPRYTDTARSSVNKGTIEV